MNGLVQWLAFDDIGVLSFTTSTIELTDSMSKQKLKYYVETKSSLKRSQHKIKRLTLFKNSYRETI